MGLYPLAVAALVSLVAVLPGQTVPPNLDGIDGNRAGFGWGSSPNFRKQLIFDSSLFPWGENGTTLHGLRLRREGSVINEMDQHDKTIRVVLSTNTGALPQSPSLQFESNHGQNRMAAFNSQPDTWPFMPPIPEYNQAPFQQGPFSGLNWAGAAAQPFTVDIDFDVDFVVPPGATKLVVDIAFTNAPILNFAWYPDEDDRGRLYGGTSVQGVACARPGSMEYGGVSGLNLGDTFRSWVGVGPTTPQGVPVFGSLGVPASPPLQFGLPCPVYHSPLAFRGPVSSTSPQNSRSDQVEFDWGTVPNFPSLIGCLLSAQHATLDPVSPGGIGMGPAYWFTIDQLPPPTFTAVFGAVEWSGPAGQSPDAAGRTGTLAATTVVEFY